MVNPFEETAQAARDWDWNPREAFISSQGVDQSIQGLIRDHKNKQQYWEDLGGSDPYPSINSNRSPTNRSPYKPSWMEAGITNPNLNGYKVMNALSIDPTADDFFLRELFNYGKRYLPGYDREQDEWRQKKYRDSLKGEVLPGEIYKDTPGELYPDKILRDLYPYTYGGQLVPEEPYVPSTLERWEEYRDEGETGTLEANLSQTWQAIVDRTGSEELANQWLESQQANRGGIIGLL